MSKISRESLKSSNKLTDTEKLVLDHMLEWEEWNRTQGREDDDVFIISNESGLTEIKANILFEAIYHLIDLGILKRRECDAVAYEWNNRAIIEDYI